MLKLDFVNEEKTRIEILCLGAHSDDIEIGCGGTVLKMLSDNRAVSVYWVVLSAEGERIREARESAEIFLVGAERKEITIKGFKDGFFPYHGSKIKEYFEGMKEQIFPDLIFTHYRHDLHQDHRLISELTWNTFRDHLILEYEVIKYDGDIGQPGFFVPLNEGVVKKKLEHIFECFKSQESKPWFTKDALLSILRIRGVECNAPDKYAEAFYCRKIVV